MRTRKNGFTLLELLIVVSLIAVLAGLLIPAFLKVQKESKKRQAQVEASVIGTAIQAYKLQERKLPAPTTSDLKGGKDVTFGDDEEGNKGVMKLLREADPPVMDAGKLRWEKGNAINPWGKQYRITLDLNYDGQVGGEYLSYKVDWDFK